MNTLVLLMMTTCTPAADPLPVIDSRSSTVPSYGSYGASGWSEAPQESRPRFFARLRNLFSRRSQGSDNLYSGASNSSVYTGASNGYLQGGTIGNQNIGGQIINPRSITYPGTTTNSVNPPFLRPMPAQTSAPPAGTAAPQLSAPAQPF